MTENYSFTRKKIRDERVRRIRVGAITVLCAAIAAALGGLVNETWAVAGAGIVIAGGVAFHRQS